MAALGEHGWHDLALNVVQAFEAGLPNDEAGAPYRLALQSHHAALLVQMDRAADALGYIREQGRPDALLPAAGVAAAGLLRAHPFQALRETEELLDGPGLADRLPAEYSRLLGLKAESLFRLRDFPALKDLEQSFQGEVPAEVARVVDQAARERSDELLRFPHRANEKMAAGHFASALTHDVVFEGVVPGNQFIRTQSIWWPRPECDPELLRDGARELAQTAALADRAGDRPLDIDGLSVNQLENVPLATYLCALSAYRNGQYTQADELLALFRGRFQAALPPYHQPYWGLARAKVDLLSALTCAQLGDFDAARAILSAEGLRDSLQEQLAEEWQLRRVYRECADHPLNDPDLAEGYASQLCDGIRQLLGEEHTWPRDQRARTRIGMTLDQG